MDGQTFETERDVLRAMLEKHGEYDMPSARDVLGLQIRMACARAGLPKPDLDEFPAHELASRYMALIAG
jgi:hypothetical protein